jgi:hypothetical protein
MQAACSFGIWNFYWTTRRHVSEDELTLDKVKKSAWNTNSFTVTDVTEMWYCNSFASCYCNGHYERWRRPTGTRSPRASKSGRSVEKATDRPAVNRQTLNASWIINEEELGRHMEYAVPRLEAQDITDSISFTYGSFNDRVLAHTTNRRTAEWSANNELQRVWKVK